MPPATALIVTPSAPATAVVGVGAAPFSVQPDGELVTVVVPAGGVGTLTPTLTGLDPSTTYSLKCRATGANGRRALSAKVTATTAAFSAANPVELAAAVNAAGVGQITAIYETGIPGCDTVVVDGTSPTGHYLTARKNAIAPTDGNHLRPRSGFTGAACTADAFGNTLQGSGLELPAGIPLWAALIGPTDDTTIDQAQGIVPNPLMRDLSCGWSVWDCGEYKDNIPLWTTQKTGGTDVYAWQDFVNAAVMRTADISAPATDAGAASQLVLSDVTFVTAPAFVGSVGATGGTFVFQGFDGSSQTDGGSVVKDFQSTDRSLQLLDNSVGGYTADGTHLNTARHFLMLVRGTLNAAQIALVRAYLKSRPWATNLWTDTRDWFVIFGDSEQNPLKNLYTDREGHPRTHLQHIELGFMGSPAALNCALSCPARSGNRPDQYQSGFSFRYRQRDLSDRGWVGFAQWEYVNSGSIPQNLAWLDETRADSRITVGTYNTQSNADNNATYNHATFSAQFVPDHAVYDLDIHNSFVYSADFWTPAPSAHDIAGVSGSSAHFANNHPRDPETQEIFTPKWRILLAKMRGESTAAMTWEVRPNINVVELTSGAPTYTPTWDSQREDRTTNPSAGAKRFFSRNTSVATVDVNTGLITAVSVGQTTIDCWDAVGGKGAIVVNVTSISAPPPDTTTALTAKLTFEADTLADTSGNGLDFTAQGAPTYATDGGERVVVLDGNDALRHVDTALLRLARAGQHGYTIILKVKPDAFSGLPFYFRKPDEWDLLDSGGNGALLGRVFASGGATIGSRSFPNGTLTAGTFAFVALTVDLDGGTIALTANGSTTSAALSGTPNPGGTGDVMFGMIEGGTNFLTGKFAEIRIYSRALPTNDLLGVKAEMGL